MRSPSHPISIFGSWPPVSPLTTSLPGASMPRLTGAKRTIDAVRRELERVAASAGFAATITRLRTTFSHAWIGFDQWRTKQNEFLLNAFRSSDMGWVHFGQPIPVLASETNLIPRPSIAAVMDQWWNDWG